MVPPAKAVSPSAVRPDGIWRRLGYEYGGGFIGSLVSGVVLFVLASRLSVGMFGLYQVVLTCVVYGVIGLNFGLTSLMSRYVPEYAASGQASRIRTLLWRGVGLILAAGALGGSVAYLYRTQLASLLQQETLGDLMILVWLWIGVRMLVQFLESAVDAMRAQAVKNRAFAVISLGQLPVVVGVLHLSDVVRWLIVSFTAIDFALVISYGFIIRSRIVRLATPPESIEAGRIVPGRSFRYAVKEYASVLLSSVWDTRIDLFLVSALLGATAAGIFGFALAIVNSLWNWSPGTVLRSVSRPLFVEAYGERPEPGRLDRLFQWYLVVSLFLAVPLFLSVALFFDPVVRLFFNPAYLSVTGVIWIIGLGMLVKMGLNPLYNVLVATERVGVLTVLNMVACTKLLVSYALIRSWGIAGGAIAFSLYAALIVLCLAVWIHRYVDLGWPWRALGVIGMNGLGMLLGVLMMRPMIDSVGTLAITVCLGLSIYIVLTLVNPPFPVRSRPWPARVREIARTIRGVGAIQELPERA